MKKILLFLLVLVAGAIAGFQYSKFRSSSFTFNTTQETVAPETLANAAKYAELQRKVSVLNEIDFDEFIRLKTYEEKYKKADEIMGKILLIFMADLGLRLTPEKMKFAKEASEGKLASTTLEKAKSTKPQDVPPPCTPQDTHANNGQRDKVIALKEQAWVVAESKLSKVKNDDEIQKYLKEVQIPDILTSIRQTAMPKDLGGSMRYVNGTFEGTLTPFDTTLDPAQVILRASLQQTTEGLSGTDEVELWQKGKKFSHNRDSGFPRSFRKFPKDSGALIIQASPTIYFQLYYLEDQDAFIGNYYKGTEEDEMSYRPKGTLRLNRK